MDYELEIFDLMIVLMELCDLLSELISSFTDFIAPPTHTHSSPLELELGVC